MAQQREKKLADEDKQLVVNKVDRVALTTSVPLQWSVQNKYKIVHTHHSPFGVAKTTELTDKLVQAGVNNTRDSGGSNMAYMRGARSNGLMAPQDVLGTWNAVRAVFNGPLYNSAFHERVSPGNFSECLAAGVGRLYEMLRPFHGWPPLRAKRENVTEMMEKLSLVLGGVKTGQIEYESILARTTPETVVFYANRSDAELCIYLPGDELAETFYHRKEGMSTWGFLTGAPPLIGHTRNKVELVKIASDKGQGETTIIHAFCSVWKYCKVGGDSVEKPEWRVCGVRIVSFTPDDVAWLP